MRTLLAAVIIVIAVLTWLGSGEPSPAPVSVHVVPILTLPTPVVPPKAGVEESKMARFYSRKLAYTGQERVDDVLLCGRWTRYYARKAGVEKHMATLMCMWHVESKFENTAGEDGKSFGRAQTSYGYQGELRRWWKRRGEVLGGDNEIQTQMAYGVAVFVIKQKDARGDLWSTVRRYNGCGPAAVTHARKVFAARDRIYGLGSPKEKPAPCPPRKSKKKPKSKNKRAAVG